MTNQNDNALFISAFQDHVAKKIKTGIWQALHMQVDVSWRADEVVVDYSPDYGSDRNPYQELSELIEELPAFEVFNSEATNAMDDLAAIMDKTGLWAQYTEAYKEYCVQTDYVMRRVTDNALRFSYKDVAIVASQLEAEDFDSEAFLNGHNHFSTLTGHNVIVSGITEHDYEFASIEFVAGMVEHMVE